jgi:hypothetical protein
MARTHPHAEASYQVVRLQDGTFGVQVQIPESYPTTVSNFASEADAEAWIVQHKTRVEAGVPQRPFRRTGNPRPPPK